MPRNFPVTAHLKAAAMLAEDVDVTEIARLLDVSPKTIHNWRKRPEVTQLIAEIQADVRAAVKHLPIANKVHRLHFAQEMIDGALAVVADRRKQGETKEHPSPGETTGHVVVKTEITKLGINYEHSFDATVHSVLAKWLEYAAKELGETETSVNVKHSGTVRHIQRKVDLSALSDDQLDQLAELAARVDAGEVVG